MKAKPLPVIKEAGTDKAKVKTYFYGPGAIVVRPAAPQDVATWEKSAAANGGSSAPNGASEQIASDLSPGDELLMLLGAGTGEETHSVEISGKTIYISKLDAPGHDQVGVLSNRDGSGALNFLKTDSLRQFYQAVILACCTIDRAGQVPYLTPGQAWRLVSLKSKEGRKGVDTLVAKAIEVNPELLDVRVPTASDVTAAKEAEKKSVPDA